MRLGQLSRKLEVKSDDIIKVLKDNFREVSNHPNIKIQEDELEYLLSHFGKDKVEASEEQTSEVQTEATQKVEEDTEEELQESSDQPVFVESPRPKVITLENEFNERTSDLESFRVEKPELEGLKVLGKIELPEPKPKAEVKENTPKEAKGDRTINERGAKRRYQKDSRRKNSKDRRTPAEQRKREEYLAEKRKKAEEQKLKELKKKHYEENVKAKIEAKPKKKKKKFVQQQATQSSSKITQSQKSASKNPVVRFWKWLNGDFDNFN